MAAATLDQMSGAVHHVRDNWGDYGYRLEYLGADTWQCTNTIDGSEFTFLVNVYGVVYEQTTLFDG